MSARRNSSFPPQKIERLLFKHGRRNVKALNLPEKFIKFAKDIVHTLVEMPWRKLLFIVVLTFFTTWTFIFKCPKITTIFFTMRNEVC